jgi:hypothetical protein
MFCIYNSTYEVQTCETTLSGTSVDSAHGSENYAKLINTGHTEITKAWEVGNRRPIHE